DYDHFRERVRELDAKETPPQLWPDDETASGTRIGTGLIEAVKLHDPRDRGYQDILLVSDGHDPASEDNEWHAGAMAAKQLGIPVHVAAVGDPEQESEIPYRGEKLKHDGKVVTTRTEERLLREIRAITGGTYVATAKDPPPLGELFRQGIENREVR